MIDFTTVHINPIPPPITMLQAENAVLVKENNRTSIILLTLSAACIVYLGYLVYKDIQDKNDKTLEEQD